MTAKKLKWYSNYGAWKVLRKGKSVNAYKGYDCITESPTATFHPSFLLNTTAKMFEDFLSYDTFTEAIEMSETNERERSELTLQEKAKIWLEAHEEDDAYINQMMSIAYKDGYKEALRWVHGFIYKTWKGDEKVLGVDVDVLKAQIEKELGK